MQKTEIITQNLGKVAKKPGAPTHIQPSPAATTKLQQQISVTLVFLQKSAYNTCLRLASIFEKLNLKRYGQAKHQTLLKFAMSVGTFLTDVCCCHTTQKHWGFWRFRVYFGGFHLRFVGACSCQKHFASHSPTISTFSSPVKTVQHLSRISKNKIKKNLSPTRKFLFGNIS